MDIVSRHFSRLSRLGMLRLVLVLAVLLSACTADKAIVYKLQQTCSADAQTRFDKGGWDLPAYKFRTRFTSHYNDKLNKCFMEVRVDNNLSSKGRYANMFVSDVLEDKDYADYAGPGPGSVEPAACNVTSHSGDVKKCHSEEEFENLVRYYME
jgi:hypothetical protein